MQKWSTIFAEYFCLICLVGTAMVGVSPDFNCTHFPPIVNFVWLGLNRQLFGACMSYHMYLMLSPDIDELPMYRPIRLIKSILSKDFLLPITVLSYSMYLNHLYSYKLIIATPYTSPDSSDMCMFDNGDSFDTRSFVMHYCYILFLVYFLTLPISYFVHTLVERPAILARRVLK